MENNKNMINFDSTDWSTIRDTYNKIMEFGEMQFGHASDGEFILFDVGHNSVMTDVIQNNGWVRRNIYHLDDYSIEELYKKADEDY